MSKQMKMLFLILVLNMSVVVQGNVHRFRRGFLSRTGICPDPSRNFQKRDRRLNYFGNVIVMKKGSNKEVTCLESECIEDSHCDADRKCCKNRCGGMVCTQAVRDPDPCKSFSCPPQQTCKIQRVKCIMPKCHDTYALNRPKCVPEEEATVLQNDDDRLKPVPRKSPISIGDKTTAQWKNKANQYRKTGNYKQPWKNMANQYATTGNDQQPWQNMANQYATTGNDQQPWQNMANQYATTGNDQQPWKNMANQYATTGNDQQPWQNMANQYATTGNDQQPWQNMANQYAPTGNDQQPWQNMANQHPLPSYDQPNFSNYASSPSPSHYMYGYQQNTNINGQKQNWQQNNYQQG
ncbi:uncharacterized protein LOC124445693 [Xenia sp. Carnegie-2017]|uniref:uncharacterized protein LOC124445693 n=1 Tax=Xenia sp. Carnegie-2017 TaxID=2897299 RepID=UPI001F04D70C|nr:uncharacterized protein LOC124445693 [Xenia sp. Carnegie-2017]